MQRNCMCHTEKERKKEMPDYQELGYESEEDFWRDLLGCDENWDVDDFFDSYDPD